jgi:hypothetical protein
VENCTVGSVRGESVGAAMVDLTGHEAGNGRHSQGIPTAHQPLFYSERFPVTRLYVQVNTSTRRNFLDQRSGVEDPRASNDDYCATCIAGGCQVPSPAGRMEGGSVFGQYKRITRYIGPSGAGSQLAFLSPAGAFF